MTPARRRPAWMDHVRIGCAERVHLQHPTVPQQTLCWAHHPTTHAWLLPTQEPVDCPTCLAGGRGRAA